jgi:hypothetical protein
MVETLDNMTRPKNIKKFESIKKPRDKNLGARNFTSCFVLFSLGWFQ